MRASLIVAALNEGDRLWRTVAACIRSVDLGDFEVIVADDASTDGSLAEVSRRFPTVRTIIHHRRRGVGPARCSGALAARGEVLVFLDGHTNPEPGAVVRLVSDVEGLGGDAVVSPRIAVLDTDRWENRLEARVGHGFCMDPETLDRYWISVEEMRATSGSGGRRLYECPALAGCCLAVGRGLYRKLRGFDRGMRMWGSEDLDFGLKAWLMGHPILHDPEAVVGHWFRDHFDNYSVRPEQILANQLRMAFKHYGEAVWHDWLRRCRARHPDLCWEEVWGRFQRGRPSAERERSYLRSRRVRDEFWYAERFGLWWPLWLSGRQAEPNWGEACPHGPIETYRAHATAPRNAGALVNPTLAGTVQSGKGSLLTIQLKLLRRTSGVVHVTKAAFHWEGDSSHADLAGSSWLTTHIEGEPLSRVRQVSASDVREALGLPVLSSPADDPAELVVGALRRAIDGL